MRPATQTEIQIGLNSFIEFCIQREKQDRFIGFLCSAKGMRKWLVQLDHFQKYLNFNHVHQIPNAATSTSLIEKHRLAEENEVFVLSTLNNMRGLFFPSIKLLMRRLG